MPLYPPPDWTVPAESFDVSYTEMLYGLARFVLTMQFGAVSIAPLSIMMPGLGKSRTSIASAASASWPFVSRAGLGTDSRVGSVVARDVAHNGAPPEIRAVAVAATRTDGTPMIPPNRVGISCASATVTLDMFAATVVVGATFKPRELFATIFATVCETLAAVEFPRRLACAPPRAAESAIVCRLRLPEIAPV